MVQGLPIFKDEQISCDGYAGKQHKNEFPIRTNVKERTILELVHLDVCGPMQIK